MTSRKRNRLEMHDLMKLPVRRGNGMASDFEGYHSPTRDLAV